MTRSQKLMALVELEAPLLLPYVKDLIELQKAERWCRKHQALVDFLRFNGSGRTVVEITLPGGGVMTKSLPESVRQLKKILGEK